MFRTGNSNEQIYTQIHRSNNQNTGLNERGQEKFIFMSTFYVTAVRYSSDPSYISHVMVHTPSTESGRLTKGVVRSKNEVITSMGQNNIYKTAVYNYNTGKWNNGAEIGTVNIGNTTYLRTDPDKTAKDNLGNLLLIDEMR